MKKITYFVNVLVISQLQLLI